MKKIVLVLAGAVATVALTSEALAIPVFARQTGMPCSACQMSLFFGGRIAENVGFMNENNFLGGPVGGIEAGFKMPFVFEQGTGKLLVIPYLTDALGVAYGFEQSSTGMTRGIRWAEHREDTSAHQYVGVGADEASGRRSLHTTTWVTST